jgi:holo-[acyl-carrier protein] synthase
MIIGIGTDLVEVDRVEQASRRHPGFLERVFTPAERSYCEGQHRRFEGLAARFAAKEAFLKALGTGLRDGISWQDMEVVRHEDGRPELVVRGAALAALQDRGATQVLISLSHTRKYGLATVVLASGSLARPR